MTLPKLTSKHAYHGTLSCHATHLCTSSHLAPQHSYPPCPKLQHPTTTHLVSTHPTTCLIASPLTHSTYTYIFFPPCNKDTPVISSHPKTPLCALLNLDPLHVYISHPNLPLPSLSTSPQLPFHTSTQSIPLLSQFTPPHTYSLHFTPTCFTPTCPAT